MMQNQQGQKESHNKESKDNNVGNLQNRKEHQSTWPNPSTYELQT